MNNIDWQPTAEIKMLKKRAAYIEKIRAFFKERNVLEVETPLLSKYAVTDPYVNAISATNQYGKKYLQTSPEYFMKRLLAAGTGSIYQICKAFRDDPIGAKHNPEFTMLEWYQEGYDHFVLMEEIYDLIKTLQPDLVSISRSYAEIFDEYLGINPHTIKQKDLAKVVVNNIGQIQGLEEPNRTECLDLLFTHMIEPELEKFEELVFIYHYPAEQAALAQTDFDDG
ncbi:MAG: lysyl-tRNA synthetase class 2, partial [Francisellaceae bacterium]